MKSSKSKAEKSVPGVGSRKVTASMPERQHTDRDLCNVNPLNEQFEPTDADPVRQHHKMAGG